jgi:hypothetical protein
MISMNLLVTTYMILSVIYYHSIRRIGFWSSTHMVPFQDLCNIIHGFKLSQEVISQFMHGKMFPYFQSFRDKNWAELQIFSQLLFPRLSKSATYPPEKWFFVFLLSPHMHRNWCSGPNTSFVSALQFLIMSPLVSKFLCSSTYQNRCLKQQWSQSNPIWYWLIYWIGLIFQYQVLKNKGLDCPSNLIKMVLYRDQHHITIPIWHSKAAGCVPHTLISSNPRIRSRMDPMLGIGIGLLHPISVVQ